MYPGAKIAAVLWQLFQDYPDVSRRIFVTPAHETIEKQLTAFSDLHRYEEQYQNNKSGANGIEISIEDLQIFSLMSMQFFLQSLNKMSAQEQINFLADISHLQQQHWIYSFLPFYNSLLGTNNSDWRTLYFILSFMSLKIFQEEMYKAGDVKANLNINNYIKIELYLLGNKKFDFYQFYGELLSNKNSMFEEFKKKYFSETNALISQDPDEYNVSTLNSPSSSSSPSSPSFPTSPILHAASMMIGSEKTATETNHTSVSHINFHH